ncbi:MAG: hypothetical protein ACOY3H_06800 [Bacillota bacterium]|uniref:Uncharacterized protein n=2 Tax=Carboxydocella TaxID=178898 RepID=A0A1T4MFD9_9FIRM|nr:MULTISPECIES: hypothetical protein [Carboxydocella]AVX21310.1 hypothetical protein CFE_2147 [Carboxydocella thermautotrophica]AVX31741.1 hypothetical protein CTH_2179 [Carboxydocella thermautotrophica]SJZ65662.1 hypothetical protein SAMN02745885_00554 [Carboxydocella sporoproducens DSM 16521]GAW29354.1 conserved hypothetical protein [Carboxydocella sp. ULO1]GAW30638.1 conserved hypothetical protein [Carboxydocella sp. JDF658]
MDKVEKLRQLLKEAAPEGRITCAQAWALAEELGVEKGLVGKICNELGIRIKACQLGCF